MFNNLVSQPLSVPNNQMDPIPNRLEVSIPNMPMGMMGGISSSPTPQQFEISNNRMGLVEVEPMSNKLGLHNAPVVNRQIEQMEGLQQYLMPNHHVGDMEGMLNNLGSQKLSLPTKRSTVGEPMVSNSVGPQISMANKNVAQMEPFTYNHPGLQQIASPNKRSMLVHSKPATPGSQNLPASNKKMVRNESTSGRSVTKQLQTPKNRTSQMEPSLKAQSESFESVRSKMRESLASALALVTQDKPSNEKSNSENEVAMTSVPADAADHVSENPSGNSPSKESSSVDKTNDVRSTSHGIFTNESVGDSSQGWKVGQEVQCDSTVLPNEDISFGDSFFVKDELLQGNGLTWAWDFDVDMEETKEEHISKKPKLVNQDVVGEEGREQAIQSPHSLAFKIEAELFKLFGGVNKKYREKGRSLLFNLKDRNNPELRERVMSGEIPPERLCSMTAEELASKELSQWRMAKAEELAQMVVLPESDVDIRRLVRKTHKGEFQVEFEQDDGVSVEVSVGASSLPRVQPKTKDTKAHPSAKADEIKDKENVVGGKSSSETPDLPCSLAIPHDGTDFMQGLMVDEFKDVDFLPPIVSLDEFMESLDAEPPFENLPLNGGKTSPSAKESSEGGYEVTASDIASEEPKDTTPEKADKVEVKYTDSDMNINSMETKSKETKSKDTCIEPKPSPPASASKGDHVWEGVIQLSVSALETVVGFFISGEKTSTKDWASSLEIKGRVRLDAFEKFVQGLPMSRSRAVMIVHFALKEGSSENDHARLSEVVQSYVSDERLGFAEATTGVEIYFCPPHPKIIEILTKNLPKHHSENLNSIENGLIGMIVWRRAQTTSPPNSNHHHHHHHHKHTSKRQQQQPPTPSRKHQERDSTTDVNVRNFPCKQTLPVAPPHVVNGGVDDDDDIPPGFGPARDEDDLPEFNFSGASNPSLSKPTNQIPPQMSAPRPVDQIRELIQRYGQPGNSVAPSNGGGGIGIQPWNNDEDDDDDIPEWQPHVPPVHSFQPPVLPHLGAALGRQPPPAAAPMPLQHPVNMAQGGGGGGRWAGQPSNLGGQPGGGQYYGGPVVRAGQTGMDRPRRGGGGHRK